MLAAVRPKARGLERQFTALLRQRPYGPSEIGAFLAITPAAAARQSWVAFLRQVQENGRRLAKLNLPPDEVESVLGEFAALLDAELDGQFEPAREQVNLATTWMLHRAYYEVREEESQTFFGLYRAKAEARNLDDLLREFVRILTRTVHARTGRLVMQAPEGKLRRPRYIERGRASERLIVDPAMRGRYASYWSYPLSADVVVQFGFGARRPWLPREKSLLDSAAARCREAIERARMEQEIVRLEAESRNAEEQERRRIGRELHDEAGQSLLLLRLHLEMLEREAPECQRAALGEARSIVERTVAELRRIIAALSPAVLDRLGLERALHQVAARFRKMHSAQVRVAISPEASGIPPQMQEVVYRVAQESLQNIAKHSQARHVNLALRSADHRIRLSVSDDGAGFSAEAAGKKPASFGVAGMRERAALLGGTLELRSAPGKGTTVVLELPKPSASGGA